MVHGSTHVTVNLNWHKMWPVEIFSLSDLMLCQHTVEHEGFRPRKKGWHQTRQHLISHHTASFAMQVRTRFPNTPTTTTTETLLLTPPAWPPPPPHAEPPAPPADLIYLHLKQRKSCWGLQPLHLGLILPRPWRLEATTPAGIWAWIYGARGAGSAGLG